MPKPKNQTRPDGFDIVLKDHQNSTHDHEDHDAELRDVLRPWSQLSAEGKLNYIASAAAMYNVSFDRFKNAALQILGDTPLPAGEHAYLRLHMQYQRALWDHELPAFPREYPMPENDPHREFLTSLDNVLLHKFTWLVEGYETTRQPFPDADGHIRPWADLSAEGKVLHIARAAAIFRVPFSRFTEAVHHALDGQPLTTDALACLRLQFDYARQVRDPSPHPLPLASTPSPQAPGHHEDQPAQTVDASLPNKALKILAEMTAQFESKGQAGSSYAQATIDTRLLETARAVLAAAAFLPNAGRRDTMRDALFGDRPSASPSTQETQPELNHPRKPRR